MPGSCSTTIYKCFSRQSRVFGLGTGSSGLIGNCIPPYRSSVGTVPTPGRCEVAHVAHFCVNMLVSTADIIDKYDDNRNSDKMALPSMATATTIYNDTSNPYRGEVTCTAMRHCLVLAGVRLTSPELAAVDSAFRSTTRPEMIGWRDICRAAVDACNNTGTAMEKNANQRELGERINSSNSPRSSSRSQVGRGDTYLLCCDGRFRCCLTHSFRNDRTQTSTLSWKLLFPFSMLRML